MFEAIVTLCLTLAGDSCRDVLLPGFELQDLASCEAALVQEPVAISETFVGLRVSGAPRCQKAPPPLAFDAAAPGVFVHLGQVAEPDAANGGDVANIGFVIGETSVAVIDSGTARWIGEGVWRAIRARTELPVSHIILTHMHPDHVLGASALVVGGAAVVGHAGLARALSDRQENYLQSIERLIGTAQFVGTEAPRPVVAVEDQLEIDLGGRVLALRTWPVSHTGTDLTVFDQTSGLLFAGDLVFDAHTPALDGSLRGWQAVMAEMAQLPVHKVVPGHGGPVLDWPEGAAPMQRYLDVLAGDTAAAIDRGDRLSDAVSTIAASEAARWQLFDAYNPRNATTAFTELEWE